MENRGWGSGAMGARDVPAEAMPGRPGSVERTVVFVLFLLTLVSGFVDATSFVLLGHVFVANMTGNVAFLGFASGGVPGFSIGPSVVAIAGFAVGALLVGRLIASRSSRPRGLLRATTAAQLLLFVTALALAAGVDNSVEGVTASVMIALLALSMGIQSAGAFYLAVPGLTRTTVLTTTLTGLAGGVVHATPGGSEELRLILSVLVLLSGATAGALLALHLGIIAPLVAVVALVGASTVLAHRTGRAVPSRAA